MGNKEDCISFDQPEPGCHVKFYATDADTVIFIVVFEILTLKIQVYVESLQITYEEYGELKKAQI